MALSVVFPGTAGSYISSADTNLLDADTAHIQQSIGLWAVDSNLAIPATQEASPNGLSPTFGGFSLQIETDTVASLAWIGTVNEAIPVAASTQYTLSYDMMTAIARNTNVSVAYYDAGGGSTGSDFNSVEAITVDAWGRHSYTFTTPALTTSMSMQIRYRTAAGNFASGEQAWIDSVQIAAGSDASFVPSLRIVGDLDLLIDAVLPIYTTTTYIFNRYGSTLAEQSFRLIGLSGNSLRFSYPSTQSDDFDYSPYSGERHTLRIAKNNTTTGDIEWFVDGVSKETDTDSVDVQPSRPGPLALGGRSDGTVGSSGDVFTATLRDGIDGPVVARFDADDIVL